MSPLRISPSLKAKSPTRPLVPSGLVLAALCCTCDHRPSPAPSSQPSDTSPWPSSSIPACLSPPYACTTVPSKSAPAPRLLSALPTAAAARPTPARLLSDSVGAGALRCAGGMRPTAMPGTQPMTTKCVQRDKQGPQSPSRFQHQLSKTPYLSTVNMRWNVSFDSTIVGGIHPEKKFPAPRERNCQGMEDLFRMDAKKKQNRNCLSKINSFSLFLHFPFYFHTCLSSTYLKTNLRWIQITSPLTLSGEQDKHNTKETSAPTRRAWQEPVLGGLEERELRKTPRPPQVCPKHATKHGASVCKTTGSQDKDD